MVITRSLVQKPQQKKTSQDHFGQHAQNITANTIGSSATGYCGKTILSPWKKSRTLFPLPIDHFAVACLVAWPLNENEAGVDLAVIGTSLLLLC